MTSWCVSVPFLVKSVFFSVLSKPRRCAVAEHGKTSNCGTMHHDAVTTLNARIHKLYLYSVDLQQRKWLRTWSAVLLVRIVFNVTFVTIDLSVADFRRFNTEVTLLAFEPVTTFFLWRVIGRVGRVFAVVSMTLSANAQRTNIIRRCCLLELKERLHVNAPLCDCFHRRHHKPYL